MAHRGAATDLEVIPVASPAPAARSRPSRWWLVVGVAVAVVGVVAVPVRLAVAREAVADIDRAWQQANSLESAHTVLVTHLRADPDPADGPLVRRTVLTVSRELSGHEVTLTRQVQGWRTHADGGVAHLARAMVGVFANRAKGHAAGELFVADRPDIRLLLARQLDRFHLKTASNVKVAPLVTADRVLLRLAHYLDEPTGTRLIASGVDAVLVIDVDGSRTIHLNPASIARVTTLQGAGPGYAVVGDNDAAYLVPLDPPARAVTLGPWMDSTLAADGRGTWFDNGTSVVEFDDQGHVLAPAVPLPTGGWSLVGAVDDGLVLQRSEHEAQVWRPQTGGEVRRLPGAYLAGHGHLLAWGASSVVHVVDLASRADRSVPVQVSGSGAFSPDGSRLALLVGYPEMNNQPVAVLDLATGGLRMLDGAAAMQPPAWSPDGRWLFFFSREEGAATPLHAYRLADGHQAVVRLPQPVSCCIGPLLTATP